MQSPSLTEELLKFCRKNLLKLYRMLESDDRHVERRARGRLDVFCLGLSERQDRLGLHNPKKMFGAYDVPLDDLKERLTAIRALADAGSLEALEDLCTLAMIAAKGVRNVQRMVYIREHQSDVPWHRKPAEQYGAIAAPSSSDQIKDADVNKMLRGVEKRIASDGPAGQEQEGLNA